MKILSVKSSQSTLPTLLAAFIIALCVCFAFTSKSQGWSKADTTQTAKSVQCKSITRAGTQCKLRTKDVSGMCWIHIRQAAAKTRKEGK